MLITYYSIDRLGARMQFVAAKLSYHIRVRDGGENGIAQQSGELMPGEERIPASRESATYFFAWYQGKRIRV